MIARVVIAQLAAAVLAGQQDPVAAFDALAAAADASAADAAVGSSAAAVTAYLQLPLGAARTQRLPAASHLAWRARQHSLALDLAAAAHAAHLGDERVAAAELGSNVALGRFAEFAAAAQLATAAGQTAAVAAALRRDEAALLPAADRLLRSGASEPALWIFRALADQTPKSAVRLANLALAQRHVGDRDGALASYREALELAPNDEQIWNDYALLLRGLGQFDAALLALRRSQSVEPTPGAGPAITNLVHAEVVRAGSVLPEPLPAAATALALRPDAQLLRRLVLELVLARAAGVPAQQAPDKRAGAR